MAIYIPETSSIIQGVSAILIMITGISAGIGCYRRGKRQENTYLYWAGAFQALMATFYLGTTVSFFTLIFTGSNLDTTITGWLAYTWAPLLSALSMYISFSLIKPKLIKPFTIGALISAPVYWYGLYFNSASSITAPNLAEFSPTNLILIDLELIGLVDTMTTVYLVLFVVLIVPGMLVLAKRTTGIIRKKALLQSLGYTLFVICGYLDSSMDWPAIIDSSLPQLATMPWLPLVIVRIVMISAFVFLFYGFTKSE